MVNLGHRRAGIVPRERGLTAREAEGPAFPAVRTRLSPQRRFFLRPGFKKWLKSKSLAVLAFG